MLFLLGVVVELSPSVLLLGRFAAWSASMPARPISRPRAGDSKYRTKTRLHQICEHWAHIEGVTTAETKNSSSVARNRPGRGLRSQPTRKKKQYKASTCPPHQVLLRALTTGWMPTESTIYYQVQDVNRGLPKGRAWYRRRAWAH